VLGHAAHIARGLVREAREGCTFRLRLDDAAQGSADEQRIIDRPGGRAELAHGDAEPRAAVHLLARLHQPAGLGQLAVNRHPRAVFGMKNVLPRDRGALAMRSSPAPANFAQFQRFR
jgi:hypothetical protein